MGNLNIMSKSKKRMVQLFVVLIVIGIGALGMIKLTESKPKMKKQKPPVPLPMARTVVITTRTQAIVIKGEGTVSPVQEMILAPQVDGKLVYISPSLINGGAFRKGDILLRIEQEDYRLSVTLAESKVKNAQSLLRLAEEESAAAKEEWFQLYLDDKSRGKEPPPLVLKEPQLAAAKAKLAADNASLRKALLDLERTELKAPFSGRVETESVDLGQYVRPGEKLASLFSTDVAEVVVPLEDESLLWFHVPGFTPGKGPGSGAKIMARIAGRDRVWEGQVVRSEGKMDQRTRMIRVVVRVDKPYAKKPPLAIGLFVRVEIKGQTLPDLAVIPRSALHQGDVVWVVDKEDRLRFRRVVTARIDGEMVQIREGLNNGENVIVSDLKAVTDGMVIRPVPEEAKKR
jgi:RND family efflux transporter MFP subunit